MPPSPRRSRNRRIASRSAWASFAEQVTPEVAKDLRAAELLGLRGDTEAAMQILRSAAAALAGRPGVDDDLVAIGEMATVVATWGGDLPAHHEFLESLAESAEHPKAKGALLFTRGRTGTASETPQFLTQALGEFTIAGDLRGRAVTLGELAWPRDDGLSSAYRVRVGTEGLDLAKQTGDQWAIAFCAGRLAGCETYLDMPGALEHWEQAAMVLPSSPDAITAEIASLNQFNWAHTALGHGNYRLASRVSNEGKVLAHGATWARKFAGVEALVAWRTGDLDQAMHAGQAARAGRHQIATGMGGVAMSAYALEREGRPDTRLIDDSLRHIEFDEQMLWLALSVQASLRVARREPSPLRDVAPALEQAERMQIHFGWEDLVLVMAEHRPADARAALARMADLWPTYPRGEAVRSYVAGLVAEEDSGFRELMHAAEAFASLPEPITAARALHAAASVAPTTHEGNRLRWQAIEIFRKHRAERSLAIVLRDRKLHRGPDLPPVPESQRMVASAGLTPREREVAVLAARGFTAQEIAESLHISIGTARNHVLHVREKFGGVPKRKLAQLFGENP
ncbi:LuxR C-terminal-related transcriptional regulator [Knoellia locipacati]|uniref:LuxR C-terminal-related transcriptional regulator n=1 Tax=Knoellia locipacati TaxID=882824 RepID=UPI00384B06B7